MSQSESSKQIEQLQMTECSAVPAKSTLKMFGFTGSISIENLLLGHCLELYKNKTQYIQCWLTT